MTPEEIIKHCFSFTDIIVGGPETGEDYLAMSQKDLLTVISIAQREAVEKTKRAMLFLIDEFDPEGRLWKLECIIEDKIYPEKILSQSEKEGE